MFWPYENENESKNIKDTKKYVNVVRKNDFFTLNEIQISQRILQIPGYLHRFNPVLKNSYINLTQVDNDYFENCININSENSYSHILLKKKYVDNTTFLDFFYRKIENPREYLLTIINSYKYLLDSIELLNKYSLVNLDIHPSSIIMKDKLPILVNFEKILHVPTINEERKRNLLSNYQAKNVFLPLEAHVIYVLNDKFYESLSFSNIHTICDDCEKRLSSLNIFSKTFIKQYKELCVFSLESFINKPKDFIINELLKKSTTWNNYSLSILYLILLRDIFKDHEDGFLNNRFISHFFQLLTMNIHPFDLKRFDIKKNKLLFDNILSNTNKNEFLQLIQNIESFSKNTKNS